MNISLASLKHANDIAMLHTSSWRATYGDLLNESYLRDIVHSERISVWQNRLEHPKENQYVVVAEENGVVVGFACAFAGEHPDSGSYIDNLHVAQSHQGRGLGRDLLAAVAALCEQKCPNQGVYLLVNQANVRAQQFYHSLGARNAQAAIWDAPEGTKVPAFWFVWRSALQLTKHRTITSD